MKLLAAVIFLAACGHHGDERKPCTNPIAHLEIVSVEDNSEYIKSVYAHVGADQRNRPTDPDAIAAGVSAEIDLWSETRTKAGIELLINAKIGGGKAMITFHDAAAAAALESKLGC